MTIVIVGPLYLKIIFQQLIFSLTKVLFLYRLIKRQIIIMHACCISITCHQLCFMCRRYVEDDMKLSLTINLLYCIMIGLSIVLHIFVKIFKYLLDISDDLSLSFKYVKQSKYSYHSVLLLTYFY